MTTERILQIEKLTKVYGKGKQQTIALRGITFDVLQGEFLGIMGASGSGKTTLLNCVASIIKPTNGKILLKNQDIASFSNQKLAQYRGNQLGYLFQDFELLDNLTAFENIILPLALHGISAQQAKNELVSLAEKLEIASVLDKFPSQLSGGQKQRVAAARALIANPSIVLADEPTGALDTKNAKTLMTKLVQINAQDHKTIMMVTHDASVASYCSRILFIQDGLIFHELRRSVATESPILFYERILDVMAQLGGGSAHVL